MLQCPICKEWKANYYRIFSKALGRVLGAYPAIVETTSEWLLLESEGEVNRQYFDVEFPYSKYEDYEDALAFQDQILIYLCMSCATQAQSKLDLQSFELTSFSKRQCPCCGYFTIEEAHDICPVCFWHYDGWDSPHKISGPNHITLRQGRLNFRAFGAKAERSLCYVRRPYPEEYPRFHV